MVDSVHSNIYIVSHKDFVAPTAEGYIPILAGATCNHATIATKDNTGENISSKNPQYCELTAQYWVWKNALDCSENIGFVHYRRYFYLTRTKKGIVPAAQFTEDLRCYDIVLPEPWILTKTVRNQFAQFHNIADLEEVRSILSERYPDYLDAFDEVLDSHAIYSYNMFVMNSMRFADYMKWLFEVLGEAERRINITSYNQYNQRIFGFLSERLLTVWVKAQQLKVKSYPVYKPEDCWWKESARNTVKRAIYG